MGGSMIIWKTSAVGSSLTFPQIVTPWFCTSDPPVRNGVYQIKNYLGVITEAYFDGAHFLHTGLHIRAGLRIGTCTCTIYRWRGVTLP